MTYYASRKEKAKWVSEEFEKLITEQASILDIGCGEKYLQNYLPEEIEYVGVDINGDPDVCLDLDSEEKFPFDDNSFELVTCLDVLEHLENIHFVFEELLRITKEDVLISLPNPFNGVFSYLLRKEYRGGKKRLGKYMKFYGLPLEKPKDRHRWFFNTEEALDFINYQAKKNNVEVEKKIFVIDRKEESGRKILKRIISGFNRKRLLNWFNPSTWFWIKVD